MEELLHYSALIFDFCQEETDSFETLCHDIDVFAGDPACAQIVVSCLRDWQLRLSLDPKPKTMLVRMADHPYAALINGLKAVSEENVLVVGLAEPIRLESKDAVLDALKRYPAIHAHAGLQGFDTRLLMFCLQHAVEQNISIDSYSQAVSACGDTPILTL